VRKDIPISTVIRFAAIAGNFVFIAWMLVNGIDENFSGAKPVELATMIGLLFLLTLNIILLYRQK
jgi:hypothetical protein